ncbi:hypothetical protein ACIBI9_65895 [Nonomuraea sp. NPDC050451]|uniref:hypothetical protein n=1 Tax=Nonomuraea sp. NPDC050451 TaxID=3364364 RepID=UPI0037B005B5
MKTLRASRGVGIGCRMAMVTALIAGGLAMQTLVAAEPAHAGPECRQPFCGKVDNHAKKRILISRDWCGGGERKVGNHPCYSNGRNQDPHYAWVQPGQGSSRYFKDTDAFLVDVGCRVTWYSGGIRSVQASHRPQSEIWIRVHNNERIWIADVRC